MADINNVTLTGRLARDPEIKTGGNYDRTWTSAKFTLAVGGTKREGAEKADVEWVPCTAWGKTAELLQKYCHKGDRIGVVGKFHSNTTEKDGNKRTYYDIRVDTIHFLGTKGDNANGGGNDGYSTAYSTPEVAQNNYEQAFNGAASSNGYADLNGGSLRTDDPFSDDSPLDMNALSGMGEGSPDVNDFLPF